MENETVPRTNLGCGKNESDSEVETSSIRSDRSTQSRIIADNHHRKFLKLACKTEKGLEWVTATTTKTGLSIRLVVGDENQDQEELAESNASRDNLINPSECEWFESCVGESGSGNKRKHTSREANIGDELFRFLFKMPTAPINGVFRLKEWYTGKYKYVDKNSPIVRAILDVIKLKYCALSIEEIYDHVMSCDLQYYAATFGNFSDLYYSIEQSIDELENVLLYQFDNNTDSVESFLKNLYDVLNKNLPKINTIFVHGTQYGGKSFFFDAVAHYCINFGQIGNFNAYSRFPFQDCINRRVLLWNDPNVESSAWKLLQAFFGGEAINVKVNDHDDYTVIGRTPIIILASQAVLHGGSHNNRFTYNWKGNYPRLKDLNKKPFPIAIYHLFKKYNLIDTVLSNKMKSLQIVSE
ncbi:hypothetical protein HA402_013432 [Bradysia odoriphaga]|nr:hypothetical protein HA402_013432 [Bradysia odoriphaga]